METNKHLLKLREMKELMDLINPPPAYIERMPELRKKQQEESEPRSSRSRLWRTKKIIDYTNPDPENIRIRSPPPKPDPPKSSRPPRPGGKKSKKVQPPPPPVDDQPEERRISIIDMLPNITWNFNKGEPDPPAAPEWMEPFDTTGFFEPRYDLLPMELILIIFKQITTSDRIAAGETCLRWNEASHFYEPFLDQTYYHFDRAEFGDNVAPFKYFSKGFRYYPRLVFTQVEFNKHSDFWEVHGLWITELTLRSCIIRKKKFLSIMRNLLNLRRLELMQCDELFKNWTIEYNTQEPMFPFYMFCLRHLSLSGCDYFNEFHFERFITMAPNLQSIDVSNCFINLYLSKRITMLDRVMKLISRNRYLMKNLNLADTPCVDDFAWHCLCDIDDLRLTHFTIAYSDRVPLKEPGIIRFFTLQTELTYLDLTSSIGLNDECMQIIITSCLLLHTLKIRRCWLLSDEGVIDMHTLQHLRALDISSCERISDYGIMTGIVGKRNREMHEIHLSLLNNLSDSTLYYIVVTFKNLQILDLDSTANSVTDECIQYIACYLHNLRHLNVVACTKLLVSIFKFLSTSDRNAASYTCSKWYEASKYLGFARQMVLHLVGVEFDDCKPPVADLLQSPHVFPVLKLTRVRLQQSVYSQFWKDFGPAISEITFEKCMIWRERIIKVLKHMQNLRTARFMECDLLRDDLFKEWKYMENGLMETTFQSIETLSLAKNNFTELQFGAIVEMMPNLVVLDLSNCFSYVDSVSKTLMLNCILRFVRDRQCTLKGLILSGISLDDLFLRGLTKAQDLRLESFSMMYLEKMPLRDPAIINFLRQQTEMRNLDLSHSTGVTDFCLDQIVRYMKKLKILNLTKCWNVGDYGVSQIFRLQMLQKLDLSQCRITKKGIIDGSSQCNRKVLKELHLEQINTLDDDCVVKIGANFTHLTVLNIGGSSSCMTDWSAQYIFYNLTCLEDANFERSTKTFTTQLLVKIFKYLPVADRKNTFSELQFNVMVDMMPNLAEVDFSNCFRSVSSTRKAQLLNCILTFIQHRQNDLKSLNLGGIPVDDIFLRGMVKARGLLMEQLTLTYLEKLPRKLPAIIDLLQQQTAINVLDLSQSTGINDYCIDQIVRNMTSLRIVRLTGCCGVSDYGVAQLFKLRMLELVDLSKCRISKRGILDGAANSSKATMKELHLELLSPLDDECVVKIGSSFSNLTVLNMGGSTSCMTDCALQHIFYNLSNLEHLNLERSTKLTDAGFTGIDLPQKTFAIWDIEETFSIDRLKKLRVLKVSGCYKLTDFSLRYAFRFMELKELSLSRCHQISKQGIEKLVTSCPALEYLDLSECPNINDYCIELIAQNLKRLSTLKLANCPLISEVGLSYLSQFCKNLKYLYVRGCFKLPPDISERLANITTLRQVYKS